MSAASEVNMSTASMSEVEALDEVVDVVECEADGAQEAGDDAVADDADDGKEAAAEDETLEAKKLREFKQVLNTSFHHLARNSCLGLRPSKLHGVGVFTMTDIASGAKMWAPLPPVVRITPELMAHLPEDLRGVILERFAGDEGVIPSLGLHVVGVVSYLNHHNSANAKLVDGHIEALRCIAANEEVTIDYREAPGWEQWLPASRAERRGRGGGRRRGGPRRPPPRIAVQAEADEVVDEVVDEVADEVADDKGLTREN
jgi:hypothetical protein